MGELIEFDAKKHVSKVFTQRVQNALALANNVTRELRKHNCTVVFAAVDGERPFLVVEADAPLHVVPWGRFGLLLQQTPGNFVACQSYLLGCQIHWKIRPIPIGRVG